MPLLSPLMPVSQTNPKSVDDNFIPINLFQTDSYMCQMKWITLVIYFFVL